MMKYNFIVYDFYTDLSSPKGWTDYFTQIFNYLKCIDIYMTLYTTVLINCNSSSVLCAIKVAIYQ